MSVRLVANTLDYVHGIPHGAKLVLICMADYADDKGRCWPSFQKLSERCDMSRRHVIRVVADLEEMGFVRKAEERPYKPTIYALNIPTSDTHVTRANREVVTPPSLVTPEPLVTPTSLGSDTHVTTTSDIAMSPKPPINHQEPPERRNTRSRRSPETAVDPLFCMTAATEAWCQEQGYSRQLVERQREMFVLSAQAKGRRYSDWQAAFRNWLKKCETDGWGQVKEATRSFPIA